VFCADCAEREFGEAWSAGESSGCRRQSRTKRNNQHLEGGPTLTLTTTCRASVLSSMTDGANELPFTTITPVCSPSRLKPSAGIFFRLQKSAGVVD
jgi:hypothetical protein